MAVNLTLYNTNDNTASGTIATTGPIVALGESAGSGYLVGSTNSNILITADWVFVLNFINGSPPGTAQNVQLFTGVDMPSIGTVLSAPHGVITATNPGTTHYDPDVLHSYTIILLGGVGTLSQTGISIVSGKIYNLNFDVIGTAGSLQVYHGDSGGVLLATWTTGIHVSAQFTAASSNSQITFVPSSDFSGSVDNVSLKQEPNTFISESTNTTNSYSGQASNTTNTFTNVSSGSTNTYQTKN